MCAFNQTRVWLKELAAGDLNNVIHDIKESLKNNKEGKLALSLLNTIASGKHSDLRPEDVYRVCQLCFEVAGVNNLSCEKYKLLCATYHILKYLIAQERVDLATKLSVFILPITCCANESEICNVMYNCFYMFYCLTKAKRQNFFAGEVDISSLLSICRYSLKFLACCIGKYLLNILDISANIVNASKLSSADEKLEYIQFVKDILDLTSRAETERSENITSESVYKAFMALLRSALVCIIETRCNEEIQIILKKIFHCLTAWSGNDKIINKSFEFLKTVLNVLLDQPSNYTMKLQTFIHVLEQLKFRHGYNSCLNWTYITISHTIIHLCSQWVLLGKNEWNSLMPVEAQIALSSFIIPFSEVFQTSNCWKCSLPSGEECSVKNDTIYSLNLLLVVVNCATLSFSYQSDGYLGLLSSVHSTLNEAITTLKALKAANCLAWKDMWKSYGIKIFNLGFYCKTAENNYGAKEFYSKFCWTCLSLGEQLISQEDENGLLGKGLKMLCQTMKELRKLRGALRVVAIGLIVSPNMKDYFLKQWAKIKIICLSNNCSDIQILTIYDILMEDKTYIELRCPGIDFSTIDFPQLLLWELQAYKLASFANLKCIQRAYGKLCTLSPQSSCLKMEALLLCFPVIWMNGSIEETSDFIVLVESSTEKFKKCLEFAEMEKMYQLCLLGNIHYWLFMCQLKVTRATKEIEIQNCEVIPTKFETQEDNHDHLARCDIIPAYKNLNLKTESQLLFLLNEAVSFWFSALQTGEEQIMHLEHLNPLANIEVTAFIYELYGYDFQMLRTWCLYYKYAKASNKKEGMLQGICQLIEWCTCGQSDCKWLTKAQEHLRELKLKEQDDYKSQMLYHKYLLAYAYHCVRNEKLADISNSLEQLSEFTERDKLIHFDKSILHVKVGFLMLEYKYNLPPDVTYASKRKKHPLNEGLSTYVGALSLTKQDKMTPVEYGEVLSLMLRVSLYLGQLYLNMFWPRDARCYMKGDLLLAQKLGLVTRTSEFLKLLALVDVMCCNVDDCQVKLLGMEVILQLESRFQPCKSEPIELDIIEEVSSQFENLDFNRLQFSEFRNCGAKTRDVRNLHCSPVLRKNKLILPSFLRHPFDCSCCMCNTIVLQTLVLYTTYIQAEIYNIKSEKDEALEFFRGALQIYNKILNKQEKCIGQLNSELNETLFDDNGDTQQHNLHLLLLPLHVCSIIVTRSYADLLASAGLIDMALKLNKEISQKIELYRISSQISLDIMEQLLCIEHLQASAQIPPKEEEENVLSQNMMSKQLLVANCRTPLTSSSVLNRLNAPSVCKTKEEYESPFRIIPRKFILDSAEDYLEKENEKTVCSDKKKQQKCDVVAEKDDPAVKNTLPIMCRSKRKQVTKSVRESCSVSEKKVKPVRGRRKVVSNDDDQSSMLNTSHSEITMKQVRGRKKPVISSSSTSESSTSSLQENLNDAFIKSTSDSDKSAPSNTDVKEESEKTSIKRKTTRKTKQLPLRHKFIFN